MHEVYNKKLAEVKSRRDATPKRTTILKRSTITNFLEKK